MRLNNILLVEKRKSEVVLLPLVDLSYREDNKIGLSYREDHNIGGKGSC